MKRICLGRITDAHGVRGLVKILPYGDDPALMENLCVYDGEESQKTVTIELDRPQGRHILARIKGCDDRDAALALRGTELWAARDDLPETGDDEFYIEDLKGLAVRVRGGDENGHVVALRDFGASPLLEIRPPAGQSYYLPFTKECVPEIHMEDGFIIIDPPEGLLDQDG
jgi:16S rRNA processing protein RimM